jgi:hypothetical protein
MPFALERLQALCEYLVEREHPDIQPDPAAIVAAHIEAEQIAGGRPEDEAAALFLALARRSRALGSIAKAAIPAAARAAAFENGRELVRADATLALDRLRILRGAMTWKELRAAFAECLQPLGAPEKAPPKRPR